MDSTKWDEVDPHDVAGAPYEDEEVDAPEADITEDGVDDSGGAESEGEAEEALWEGVDLESAGLGQPEINLDDEDEEGSWSFDAGLSALQDEEDWPSEVDDAESEELDETDGLPVHAGEKEPEPTAAQPEEFLVCRENWNTINLPLPSYPWFSG